MAQILLPGGTTIKLESTQSNLYFGKQWLSSLTSMQVINCILAQDTAHGFSVIYRYQQDKTWGDFYAKEE